MERDVAEQLTCEIGRPSEALARNPIVFDGNEPAFHLAESTAVRQDAMHRHEGMSGEPVFHRPGLLCGELAEDEVDRLAAWRRAADGIEQVHELGTGVTDSHLVLDMAGAHVERRV